MSYAKTDDYGTQVGKVYIRFYEGIFNVEVVDRKVDGRTVETFFRIDGVDGVFQIVGTYFQSGLMDGLVQYPQGVIATLEPINTGTKALFGGRYRNISGHPDNALAAAVYAISKSFGIDAEPFGNRW